MVAARRLDHGLLSAAAKSARDAVVEPAFTGAAIVRLDLHHGLRLFAAAASIEVRSVVVRLDAHRGLRLFAAATSIEVWPVRVDHSVASVASVFGLALLSRIPVLPSMVIVARIGGRQRGSRNAGEKDEKVFTHGRSPNRLVTILCRLLLLAR
jgi:hypothetical protein